MVISFISSYLLCKKYPPAVRYGQPVLFYVKMNFNQN